MKEKLTGRKAASAFMCVEAKTLSPARLSTLTFLQGKSVSMTAINMHSAEVALLGLETV